MSAHYNRGDLAPLGQAFNELGRDLGLPSLALDEHHSLSLVFDSHLVVEVQASPEMEMVFFLAALSALPELAGRAETGFFRQLLAAPLARRQMGGAFFALDPESEEILLARALPLTGLDRTRLEPELEQFVTALEYWNHQVKGGFLHLREENTASAFAVPPETGAVRI